MVAVVLGLHMGAETAQLNPCCTRIQLEWRHFGQYFLPGPRRCGNALAAW